MADRANIFEKFERRNLSAKSTRLLNEWKAIHELLEGNSYVSYIVRHTNRDDVPDEYEIIYNIRSIVGVEEPSEITVDQNGKQVKKRLRMPIMGNQHKMQIKIPPEYPNAVTGKPSFKMLTDVWHPNIRYFGDLKGRICLNESNLDAGNTLADRVMDVAFYLKYERYFAQNEPPFPEDEDVALWIREEGEPNKWVASDGTMPTDDCDLYEKPEKVADQPKATEEIKEDKIPSEAPMDDIEVVQDYEMEQQGMKPPDWANEDDQGSEPDEDEKPFVC
jgi:hypothetical protein